MGEKMMKKFRKSPIYEINTEAKSFIDEEVSEIQSIIQAEVNKFRNLYSNSIFVLQNASSSKNSRKTMR